MLDLEPIKARADDADTALGPNTYWQKHYAEDARELIAEVEQLRALMDLDRAATAVRNAIAQEPERLQWLAWVPDHLDQITTRAKILCKHEQATYVRMLDETRQIYTCDACGWEHYTAVDPGTGDLVNFDAKTGEAQAHR